MEANSDLVAASGHVFGEHRVDCRFVGTDQHFKAEAIL